MSNVTMDADDAARRSDRLILAARVAMGLGFVVFGFTKLLGIAGTTAYISMHHLPLPQVVFWIAVVLEVGLGAALIAGYETRSAAGILAFYCLFTAAFFHNDLTSLVQRDQLLKNLIMAGGFLCVAATGAGRYSVDHRRVSRE